MADAAKSLAANAAAWRFSRWVSGMTTPLR
jgi:hypothetical protein